MTAASSAQGNRFVGGLRRVIGTQEGILALLLIALIIGVGLYNPRFLNERNLTDVFNANAYVAVAAIGISMIIITGNIDISVGRALYDKILGLPLRALEGRPSAYWQALFRDVEVVRNALAGPSADTAEDAKRGRMAAHMVWEELPDGSHRPLAVLTQRCPVDPEMAAKHGILPALYPLPTWENVKPRGSR